MKYMRKFNVNVLQFLSLYNPSNFDIEFLLHDRIVSTAKDKPFQIFNELNSLYLCSNSKESLFHGGLLIFQY